MNIELQKLVDARKYADQVTAFHETQDRENPIVFTLIITGKGVDVEGRRLITGGYHGAIDAQWSVSWEAIESGQGVMLHLAIDKVTAQLLAWIDDGPKY